MVFLPRVVLLRSVGWSGGRGSVSGAARRRRECREHGRCGGIERKGGGISRDAPPLRGSPPICRRVRRARQRLGRRATLARVARPARCGGLQLRGGQILRGTPPLCGSPPVCVGRSSLAARRQIGAIRSAEHYPADQRPEGWITPSSCGSPLSWRGLMILGLGRRAGQGRDRGGLGRRVDTGLGCGDGVERGGGLGSGEIAARSAEPDRHIGGRRPRRRLNTSSRDGERPP